MNVTLTQWRPVSSVQSLTVNDVHVWRVDVDNPGAEIELLATLLSADELERSNKFHFQKDSKRFIVSRGFLRLILGEYLDQQPRNIRFEYNTYGKPSIQPREGDSELCFNLSHAGAYILYAINYKNNLGIDIERLRGNLEIDAISGKCFSLRENLALQMMHSSQRVELFFRYWARKEAMLKAIGSGLASPMSGFDVSSIDAPILNSNTTREGRSFPWYIRDLFSEGGYVAALAIGGRDKEITCWRYTSDR